jgi:hypothetical protein
MNFKPEQDVRLSVKAGKKGYAGVLLQDDV